MAQTIRLRARPAWRPHLPPPRPQRCQPARTRAALRTPARPAGASWRQHGRAARVAGVYRLLYACTFMAIIAKQCYRQFFKHAPPLLAHHTILFFDCDLPCRPAARVLPAAPLPEAIRTRPDAGVGGTHAAGRHVAKAPEDLRRNHTPLSGYVGPAAPCPCPLQPQYICGTAPPAAPARRLAVSFLSDGVGAGSPDPKYSARHKQNDGFPHYMHNGKKPVDTSSFRR